MSKSRKKKPLRQDAAPPVPAGSALAGMQAAAAKVPWTWVLPVLTVPLLVLSRQPAYGMILIDDAFITYTYSRNLAQHGQFVYNLGERFLATTTPLYALLLSIFSFFGADLFYAAPIFNLGIEAAAAVFIVLLLRGLFPRLPYFAYAVFAVLFFLQPYTLWCSAGGMETSLYVLLIVLLCWSAFTDRWTLAGVVAGLLLMTRPDGLIIGSVIFLYYLVSRRKFPVRGLAAFAIVYAPWLIFSCWYFGSPIPTGVSAKVVLGKDFATPLARKFLEIYFYHYKRKSLLILAGTILGLAGMGLASWEGVHRRNYKLLVLPLFFLLYNCAFMLTGTAFGWIWYFIPLYLTLYLHTGYFCAEMSSRFKPAGALAAVWLLVVFYLTVFTFLPGEYRRLKVKSDSWEIGVKRPCLWVKEHSRPEATLMCLTVGLPGYYAERRIIDPYCIASPQLLPLYPGKDKAELFFLEKTRPDFFLSWYTPPDLIPADYALVQANPMPFPLISYGSTWLYRHR